MEQILTLLLKSIFDGIESILDSMLDTIVALSLHAEEYMDTLSGRSFFETTFDVVFGFGISLIVLKFLKKGFETYIMWTDGDADEEPLSILTNFIKAVAVASCFPIMYEWLADIIADLSDKLLNAVGIMMEPSWAAFFTAVLSNGLVPALFALVFIIIYIILYFQFLMRGLEILILRLGIPLACVGLVDNDKGVFKPYLNKFFQSTLAVVIQIVLCKLGLGMMMNMHFLWGYSLHDAGCSDTEILTGVPSYNRRRWRRYRKQYVPFGKACADGGKDGQGSVTGMVTMDDISNAIIMLVRAGAAARFIYCMVRLSAAEDDAGKYKKRAQNAVIFYIIAESIWQIKDIVLYYFS